MKAGYGVYKTAQVDTNDQGKLILVTYDIAIKHAKLALEIFEERKQVEERGRHIFKVQDALEELQESLNMEAGGQIAANLYNLYSFMYKASVDANIHNDRSMLTEVLDYLISLRDAWGEATVKAKAETTPAMSLEAMSV